ncbi:MAG: bifunctional diaminohydroxyphosphoribosylaminopyrimidine deaminase/5-amino-6-(5-phosphoribosylamino)uracil reductase RibD [Armatimonadota bacterium]
MRRALRLAKRGRTSPNPMVGAVVVRDGRVVGEGFHPRAGEPHAEVFALRAAGDAARGAEMYVTLEPCCHHGRTPPCVEAIIEAGISVVHAAMIDPNPAVAGKGIQALRDAGLEVQVGEMEADARELNRGFVKRITTGLPFVTWKAAMTLDGKIASSTGDSRWVTGERARREVHKLRAESDAVVVGIGTVLADDPELTVRAVRGANPMRVVVDSRASTPPDARVLDGQAETVIAVTPSAPAERVNALRAVGAKVLTLPGKGGRVDLQALLVQLGVNNVLLESGGEIAASMLANGLVDRGLIFIAPKVIGGRDAKTPVEGAGIPRMAEAIAASRPKVRRFGDDVALIFEVE